MLEFIPSNDLRSATPSEFFPGAETSWVIPSPIVLTPEKVEAFALQALEPRMEEPQALLFIMLNEYDEVVHYFNIFGTDSKNMLRKAENQLSDYDGLWQMLDGPCQMRVVHAVTAAHSSELPNQQMVSDLDVLLKQYDLPRVSYSWILVERPWLLPKVPVNQGWLHRLAHAWNAFSKRFLAPMPRRLSAVFGERKR